jgi:large subunit ribosomal protein L4e
MKSVNVYKLDGSVEGSIELPEVFSAPYRPDLIHKAFVHIQSELYQPQGRDPLAGMRVSAESRGTGLGIARLARVKGEGTRRAGQAGGVAGVVKGRLTHPPRAEKVIVKRLNKKEKRLALYSAIAATIDKSIVKARGHRLDDDSIELPIVVDDSIESIGKAKDLLNLLNALKLSSDLERAKNSIKKRSGKARMRGRKQYIAKSVLIIVREDKGVGKAAGSIPGVEVARVDRLSVMHLAPGSHPGRLCVWSKGAIEYLRNIRLPASMRILRVSA